MERIKDALLSIMERRNYYENDIEETISNLNQIEADDIVDELAYGMEDAELEEIGIVYDESANDLVTKDEFFSLLDKAIEEAEDDIRQSYGECECMEDLYFESMRW